MANIQASVKDIRKIAKRTERNRSIRTQLRTLAKKFTAAVEAKSDALPEIAVQYTSALDKAAKRKIIHHNKASRHKSQIGKVLAAK